MSEETKFTDGPWVRQDTADYAEIHPASGKQKSAIALVGRADDADLISAAPDLLEAASDALAGWKYIRQHHGDLYGVGWDRVEQALVGAIAKARP